MLLCFPSASTGGSLATRRCYHFQPNDIGCQFDVAKPFLVEIMKFQTKIGRWFQKGPFFPGRLQYMNSITAVYQPMDPVTVCTVAKSLRIPHGHFTATAPAYKFPEECRIPIHTAYPKRDSFPQVATDFQFVIEARIIDDFDSGTETAMLMANYHQTKDKVTGKMEGMVVAVHFLVTRLITEFPVPHCWMEQWMH